MTVARGSADFIGVPCPHPALRATFSLREKGRGAPSPSGRRWTRAARPDEGAREDYPS
jgi:hypothetical protein